MLLAAGIVFLLKQRTMWNKGSTVNGWTVIITLLWLPVIAIISEAKCVWNYKHPYKPSAVDLACVLHKTWSH